MHHRVFLNFGMTDENTIEILLLLLLCLISQLSAGKHSPILGFNNQQE
jgi:hypothetical protein